MIWSPIRSMTLRTQWQWFLLIPLLIFTHAQAEPLDSLTQLLNHFHDLAHRNNRDVEDPELAARIDFLTKRNDRLSDRLDDLRDEVDTLRAENLRLKELLIKAGVSY